MLLLSTPLRIAPALLAVTACLFTINAHAVDEAQMAADCKKISSYATAGQKAYDKGDYSKARESFIEQVSWSESCQLSETAIATVYNNVALTYIKQKDFLKARAWLLLDARDKKSQYNLGLIKSELATLAKNESPAGKEWQGEYWQYAGKGAWNTVGVAAKNGQYQIEFSGLYMGMMGMYYGPNMGEFSLSSPIKNGKAVYSNKDYGDGCQIDMLFKADSVQLTSTHNDCGFGHNVYADGEFIKVSSQYQPGNGKNN